MKSNLDTTIHDLLNQKILELEEHFDADIFTYYGLIIDGNEVPILKIIEQLADPKTKRKRLFVLS